MADLSLQLSAQQDQTQQLGLALHDSTKASAAKDAHMAEAASKLDSLTQRLASHERESEDAAAAQAAAIAELTRQLQAAEASFQTGSNAQDVTVANLKQQLASAHAALSVAVAAKDFELKALTQQLHVAQHSMNHLAAKAAERDGQLADLSSRSSEQQAEACQQLQAQQEVVQKLQARDHDCQARMQLLSESSSEQAQARQQAMAALEAQVEGLTQQLSESDRSRLQLDKELESQRSCSAADAHQAQVRTLA